MNTHLQKAVNALPENMDALLVTNTRNQRWLTDFNFEDGFILVTRKESYLLTDSRYIEAAENEAKGITVLQMTGKRSEMFKKLLDANGAKSVGFEDNWVSVSQYENYKKIFEGYALVPAGKLLENLRELKDEEEIERIILAQKTPWQAPVRCLRS